MFPVFCAYLLEVIPRGGLFGGKRGFGPWGRFETGAALGAAPITVLPTALESELNLTGAAGSALNGSVKVKDEIGHGGPEQVLAVKEVEHLENRFQGETLELERS